MFYTEEQIHEALMVYDETGSVTKTAARLEYPTWQTLCHWIAERNCPAKRKTGHAQPEHAGPSAPSPAGSKAGCNKTLLLKAGKM